MPSRVVVVKGKDPKVFRVGLEALRMDQALLRGRKVVVKPNTHWAEPYPSTTDPASLVPVIEYLRDKRAGNITITDGSGIDLPHPAAAFEHIRFEEYVGRLGVRIRPLDIWALEDFVAVSNRRWTVFSAVAVHRQLYQAPVLVSLTCLKRHRATLLTAALKNMVGAIGARSRFHLHSRYRERITEAVAEVADAVTPDISVIDARQLLVRTGPGLSPDRSNVLPGVNRVIFATDPVAADVVAARLMAEFDETFDPEAFARTVRHGAALGIGRAEESEILVEEITP